MVTTERLRERLEEHGELIVQIEDGMVCELHLDATIEDDGRVHFEDSDGDREEFFIEDVQRTYTHRSHFVE